MNKKGKLEKLNREIRNCKNVIYREKEKMPFLAKDRRMLKLIVLLGRIASNTVLGEELWKCRGEILRQNKQKYFITYHPATGLRFPKIQKDFKKRFQKD